MSAREVLSQNLAGIKSQIQSACERAGRDSAAVRLVVVTKYAEWPWVKELSQMHGIFGENRPQKLAEREVLMPDAEWHLIGQLQRNKVRLALEHAAMIHSVDSPRLLQRIETVSAELQIRPKLLLEVNLSGEASKSGFSREELMAVWPELIRTTNQSDIQGLMTMAGASEDPEDARLVFRALRELRDELAVRPESRAAGTLLSELSMGMSGDFVPAVEEGATLVRIGSRIFQELE